MTEREYIQRLRENLRQIPETETEDVVEYVREYFEEAGEEETLRALGFPESFARQISADAAAKLPPLPGIASRKQQRAETAGESGCFGSDQKETAEWNSAQARRSRATVWILVLGILSLPSPASGNGRDSDSVFRPAAGDLSGVCGRGGHDGRPHEYRIVCMAGGSHDDDRTGGGFVCAGRSSGQLWPGAAFFLGSARFCHPGRAVHHRETLRLVPDAAGKEKRTCIN